MQNIASLGSYCTYISIRQAFKSALCFEILSGKLSFSEAKVVYAIKGQGTIRRWLKQYQDQCLDVNLHSMNATDSIPNGTNPEEQGGNSEDLKKTNQELEAALRMAKLKITALETMIDIAESDLNIDIRKKSGTKQ